MKARRGLSLVVWIVLVAFSVAAVAHQEQGAADTAELVEALLGFDPILLIHGEEVLGDEEIYVVHEGYQYLFTNEEHKSLFASNPERYAIQLHGICARVGGTTMGVADLYAVHEGRIYIFASTHCVELFEEAPTRYLEPGAPPALAHSASQEQRKAGRALIAKAVEAIGPGLDDVKSYEERSFILHQGQDGAEVKAPFAMIRTSGGIRRERTYPSYGTIAEVVRHSEAFYSNPNGTGEMNRAQAVALAREFKRDVLVVLRVRNSEGFEAAAIGQGIAGEGDEYRVVEQVAVDYAGMRMTLGIDPESGKVLSLSYIGRGPGGVWGEMVQTFSDFRRTGELSLPYKKKLSFDGEPLPQRTITVEEIVINGEIDRSLFRKPQKESETTEDATADKR